MSFLPIKIENFVQHMDQDELPALIVRYFHEEVVGRSPHTLYARKTDLGKFCLFYHAINGHLQVKGLMPQDVKLYLNDLEAKGYAANSRNRQLGSIRAFGSWLLENGFVKIHPCKSIRDVHVDLGVPKAPRDREYHRLRKAAEVRATNTGFRFSQHFRDMVILETLNSSGLRISELLSIKLGQLKGKRFHNVKCKGGKVRSISIKSGTCELIGTYVSSHRTEGSEYLFTSKNGLQLDRVTVWKSLKKIAQAASANLQPHEKMTLHPHMLRHRHGFKSREAKDAVFAAARLGHCSLNFVHRYTQETTEEEQIILEKID
ncbi:tyrosine-type recombinase/integrase [Bdellovibrio sp. NC01]|uniref:tyrosine-type recombinase/integrase n=1 Tax=Bdellovibrio sp. NC01 TaxID=2220073 RepID=UPI00115A40B4|nr:tyrosine-type recombinase/integrase [Bdellovibrio sp. NC01]QDK37196.1 hypothetical protein DOE51_06135 [Bdellovibrio sp. NC01]